MLLNKNFSVVRGIFVGFEVKVGDVFKTKTSGDIVVLRYNNSLSVDVKFLTTGTERNVPKSVIKSGTIKDYYYPTVCGVGYQGDISTRENGEPSSVYTVWRNMLHRCYDEKTQSKQPSYKGCYVSDYFKCYKNFHSWYHDQNGCTLGNWALDKDLLLKGNKIYSEKHCILLPREINTALINAKSARGDYPAGVHPKRNISCPDTYQVAISMFNKTTYIGTYKTPEEAFYVYKETKEKYLKTLADKWKNLIDPRAYEALINYEVHITD